MNDGALQLLGISDTNDRTKLLSHISDLKYRASKLSGHKNTHSHSHLYNHNNSNNNSNNNNNNNNNSANNNHKRAASVTVPSHLQRTHSDHMRRT